MKCWDMTIDDFKPEHLKAGDIYVYPVNIGIKIELITILILNVNPNIYNTGLVITEYCLNNKAIYSRHKWICDEDMEIYRDGQRIV